MLIFAHAHIMPLPRLPPSTKTIQVFSQFDKNCRSVGPYFYKNGTNGMELGRARAHDEIDFRMPEKRH